jgi:hypothetical protein
MTGEWLRRWLASRVSLRASTARSYAAHVRGYLVPYLGGIPLADLTPGDVQAMFTAVTRDESVLRRPVSAATLYRIHATLRAALNGAVRAELAECGWLDVKAGIYQLDDPAKSLELAKDVSAFANAKSGGMILVGYATKKEHGRP